MKKILDNFYIISKLSLSFILLICLIGVLYILYINYKNENIISTSQYNFEQEIKKDIEKNSQLIEKIAGENPEAMNYENIPGCTYCSPEIASVGLTEEQAKEKGYELKVGKFPFTASGKASASGHKDGFVKVIFDAKYGEWLGCHIIGYNVTEMISEAVVARKLETTGHEILKAVHPHPTMSEAVMEAVADAYDEVIHI